jgi:hypothetical protein
MTLPGTSWHNAAGKLPWRGRPRLGRVRHANPARWRTRASPEVLTPQYVEEFFSASPPLRHPLGLLPGCPRSRAHQRQAERSTVGDILMNPEPRWGVPRTKFATCQPGSRTSVSAVRVPPAPGGAGTAAIWDTVPDAPPAGSIAWRAHTQPPSDRSSRPPIPAHPPAVKGPKGQPAKVPECQRAKTGSWQGLAFSCTIGRRPPAVTGQSANGSTGNRATPPAN